MSKQLPLEIQADAKMVQIMAFVFACIAAPTVIGIPWSILYLVVLFKPTNKTVLKFVLFATIPLCLAIVPIFLVMGCYRLLKRLALFEKEGSKEFKTDKSWKQTKRWKRYDLLVYSVATLLILAALWLPVSTTVSNVVAVPYSTQYIQDSSLELGDTQTRQPGTNGQGLDRNIVKKPLISYIFGFIGFSNVRYSASGMPRQTTQAPVNEIIAKGTKKYQYMWCSNGSYRYYTNEQFKDSNTGFTHKSVDYCSQNKQGHMTGIADTAPPQQTTNTVYRSTYTSPTYTHCYDTSLGYSSSFSCTSY